MQTENSQITSELMKAGVATPNTMDTSKMLDDVLSFATATIDGIVQINASMQPAKIGSIAGNVQRFI